MDRFWLLRKPDSAPLAEHDHDKMRSVPIICPLEEGHRRGGKRLTGLSVTLSSGRPPDFVWTWNSDLMAQAPAIAFLHEHGLTGFATHPVNARFVKRSSSPPPKLWELQILGWGGMAVEKAGISVVEYCPSCLHKKFKVERPQNLVDPEQWDGSDFFMVWPLPRHIFISDRAATLLRDARLTGLKIIPATSIPPPIVGTYTPGRLSHWMPMDRAEALGRKFDIV